MIVKTPPAHKGCGEGALPPQPVHRKTQPTSLLMNEGPIEYVAYLFHALNHARSTASSATSRLERWAEVVATIGRQRRDKVEGMVAFSPPSLE